MSEAALLEWKGNDRTKAKQLGLERNKQNLDR
jgi:hypothetical protein